MSEDTKPCVHKWFRMSYGEKCSGCGVTRPHSAATELPPE